MAAFSCKGGQKVVSQAKLLVKNQSEGKRRMKREYIFENAKKSFIYCAYADDRLLSIFKFKGKLIHGGYMEIYFTIY